MAIKRQVRSHEAHDTAEEPVGAVPASIISLCTQGRHVHIVYRDRGNSLYMARTWGKPGTATSELHLGLGMPYPRSDLAESHPNGQPRHFFTVSRTASNLEEMHLEVLYRSIHVS